MIESLSKEQIAVLKQVVNQEKVDVPLVAGLVKKVWEGLNTDVTPVFKNLLNQISAIYDPQLQPIIEGGCVIDWIDARTGDRAWFS